MDVIISVGYSVKSKRGTQFLSGFEGSLNAIYQTFDRKELYSSLEEKVANLICFVIKNHPFSDENKLNLRVFLPGFCIQIKFFIKVMVQNELRRTPL